MANEGAKRAHSGKEDAELAPSFVVAQTLEAVPVAA